MKKYCFPNIRSGLQVPRWIPFAFALSSIASHAREYDPPTAAEIEKGYRERVAYVIDQAVANTDASDPSKGNLFDLAANAFRGENLDWVRERMRTYNDPPRGNMFWMHPMILAMYAGRDIWNEEDWAFIRGLWKDYFPYRGDTENHWVMYYVSLYLACELWPDAPGEVWYNGKSSRENMEEAREFIADWIDITTSYGQGEYDSPNYIEEYTRPMALLAGYARDPILRQQGKMMMDYLLLDYAVESLNGVYGGAHSRIYPRYLLQPSLAGAAAHGWLFWNQGEYRRNATNTLVALTGYTPPAILYHVANDRSRPYLQRELKRTRWRVRHAGEEAFEVDGKSTIPVYKTSYMHPDFILGSSQGGLLQPIQQQTWSLVWWEDEPYGKSNTFFGVHPYSNPFEGTMYFPSDWDTVTDLIARSKVDYDSPDKLASGSPYEQVYQHQATLVALHDIEPNTRFPLIHTFFSRDLEQREEHESGWITAQGGPVYLAFFPLVPGEWREVDWTGLLKGGAGAWISTNFEAMAKGSQSYVSEGLQNGYVLHVAPAGEFASYAEFVRKIEALPLHFQLDPTPRVVLETLDGDWIEAGYDQPFTVNSVLRDFSNWPLYDGPFSWAERESRELEIFYGPERYHLDFKTLTTTHTLEGTQ